MNNQTTSRSFAKLEVIFAWICYFAGYLFFRAFPFSKYPLGAFLFIVSLYITTIIVLLIKKAKIGFIPWLIVIISLATSASFIISSNLLLTFLTSLFTISSYFYFVYSATGNSLKKGLSDMIIVDYLNAMFSYPIRSFSAMVNAMFSSKSTKSSKVLSRSLLGLLIALIPTIIILALLSYDSDFWELFSSIFNFSFLSIFSHLISFAFAFPAGMCMFGVFISSIDKNNKGAITVEACNTKATKARKLSVATVVAAVAPLIIIYTLFFISQWHYYVSGFTGILPVEFSYAEYAREGFFQLCAVSVINLLIIIAVSLFMCRPNDKAPAVLRIINTIFALFTLVLICTALAKMAMYIDCYGLTPKRVCSTCLMVVLTLVFILIILKQFIQKTKAIGASFLICALLFSCFSLSNADRIIVEYNVSRYLNGTLKSIDIYDMSEIGDAAVPGLVRMYEEIDKTDKHYNSLKRKLEKKASQIQTKNEEKSIFSFNYPAYEAELALQKVGILK